MSENITPKGAKHDCITSFSLPVSVSPSIHSKEELQKGQDAGAVAADKNEDDNPHWLWLCDLLKTSRFPDHPELIVHLPGIFDLWNEDYLVPLSSLATLFPVLWRAKQGMAVYSATGLNHRSRGTFPL